MVVRQSGLGSARRGTLGREIPFLCVCRERCGELQLGVCLGVAIEARQQVSAHAVQEVVPVERTIGAELIDERQAVARARGERASSSSA